MTFGLVSKKAESRANLSFHDQISKVSWKLHGWLLEEGNARGDVIE